MPAPWKGAFNVADRAELARPWHGLAVADGAYFWLQAPGDDWVHVANSLLTLCPRPQVAVLGLDFPTLVRLRCRGITLFPDVPVTLSEALLRIERARPLLGAVDAFVEQYRLSERQRQIVLGVVEGLHDKDIELALGISRSTIRKMFLRIGQKTGAKTRVEIFAQVILHLSSAQSGFAGEQPLAV